MAYSLNAFFLLLWFLQHGGRQVAGQNLSVQQESLIQVAFVHEFVSMISVISYPYTKEYTTFKIHYYRMDSEGKTVTIKKIPISEAIPPGKENEIARTSFKHQIGPLDTTSATGTYYCQVQWKNTMCTGNGIFILVRDTGYTEPPPGMWKFLVALTTILAILSIAETAVLLWKRKVMCFGKSYLQRCPDPSTVAQAPSGSSEPSGSIYTCLDSHQADVYSVLENDTNSLSLEKNPTAKLQDMVSSQPDSVGNRIEDSGKAGKRKKKKETKSQQETPEEPFDMLYENI